MDGCISDSEFLQTFIDAVPSLLFVVDRDVRVIHVNRAAARTIGPEKDLILMKSGGDILHCIYAPETPEGCGHGPKCPDCVIRNSVSKAFDGQAVFRRPAVIRVKSRENFDDVYFNVTATPLTYKGIAMVLLVLDDVTGQKKVEKALSDSEDRLRNIMSVMGEGVLALDAEGSVTFMNSEAERLLGWKESELIGRNFHMHAHYMRADGSDHPAEECEVLKSMSCGKPYHTEEDVLIRKDGTMFPVSFACNPIRDGEDIVGSVAAFHDITKIKEAYAALSRANELLEHQATTDPLTGISNRLKFEEVLMKEISRARRHQIPLALVMFDIDHFKVVNDTCGHHIGDMVLQQLTAHIANSLRKHDYFVRWGGEEFMILLTHNTRATAMHFTEIIRAEVEALRIPGSPGITCSFGVTQMTEGDDTFSLTKRVDNALYNAKAAGRNRVEAL